jgi:hypothetical protein
MFPHYRAHESFRIFEWYDWRTHMAGHEIGRRTSGAEAFCFVFETDGKNHVRILRLTEDGKCCRPELNSGFEEDGRQVRLFDYTWPSPLKITAECSIGEWQNGIFTFTLRITSQHAHHAEAGEFTEEEIFAIEDALTEHPVCRVIRIVRRNAHTGAVRVLPHLPVQTYPPVDGRQGPYGHPKVRTHSVIPRRRISPYNKG